MKFIIGFMRTLCQDEHQYLAATPETELQLPPPLFLLMHSKQGNIP